MVTEKKSEVLKWMGAILDALRTLGGSGTPTEVVETIANNLHLSDKKREELRPSGVKKLYNEVCWARQLLVWEGYIDSSKRGIWTLTSSGEKQKLNEERAGLIARKWNGIFSKRRKTNQKTSTKQTTLIEVEDRFEEEAKETGKYKEELISILRSLNPRSFEELCLLLLRENGFENLKLTSLSRDGGIDGISTLRINPFVSFKVLFQCKRYNGRNPIKREQIGDFRNAMLGRADKGIFITTGYFSADAEREANRDGATPIELVDCDKLIEMFEKAELGLTPVKSFEIDRNFFKKYMES